MSGLWVRLYTEIKNDRKLRRLPPARRWLWVVLRLKMKEVAAMLKAIHVQGCDMWRAKHGEPKGI